MTPEQIEQLQRILDKVEEIVEQEYAIWFNRLEFKDMILTVYEPDGETVREKYKIYDTGTDVKRTLLKE